MGFIVKAARAKLAREAIFLLTTFKETGGNGTDFIRLMEIAKLLDFDLKAPLNQIHGKLEAVISDHTKRGGA